MIFWPPNISFQFPSFPIFCIHLTSWPWPTPQFFFSTIFLRNRPTPDVLNQQLFLRCPRKLLPYKFASQFCLPLTTIFFIANWKFLGKVTQKEWLNPRNIPPTPQNPWITQNPWFPLPPLPLASPLNIDSGASPALESANRGVTWRSMHCHVYSFNSRWQRFPLIFVLQKMSVVEIQP